MPVSPGEDPDDALARGPASATNQHQGAGRVPQDGRPVIQAGQRDKFFDSEKISIEDLREADANAVAAGQADNT